VVVTMAIQMDSTHPPFPQNVPTHPLVVVDYQLLREDDEDEIDKLWKAATELGFWYLKNHGADKEVQAMFEMGSETMKLPMEEKMKFEQGDGGRSCGYKAAGTNAVNETGAKDTVEFINVSQDDALAWPNFVHRTYPSTVNDSMDSAIKPFMQKSMEVNRLFLDIFEKKLGLPEGELTKRHRVDQVSGSEARCIKNPPKPEGMSEAKTAIGAHTDFGSLSFLHNRLGGLQVLVPGTEEWQYVKPIPGHAICNLGDAMAIFSSGILRSNLHRVITPPGEQSKYTRWSLVFFTRPGGSVVLEPLKEQSSLIAEAAAKEENKRFDTGGATAGDWFARRIRNQRINNRTGPETWRASRGTEHRVSAE